MFKRSFSLHFFDPKLTSFILEISPPVDQQAKSFFQRFLHHFKYGSLPFGNDYHSNPFLNFPFEVHTGPISDAIALAKSNGKLLFLYIYCSDSLISSNVNEILCLPNVSESIRLNFIFCAIECTTPEGWEIAINFKFEKIPIIGILRPHGDTLKQCDLLVKHEGPIGEVGIISYFSIVHQNETNSSIIQQQDIEYLRAVQEAEANNMTTQEIEEEALHNEQIRIEEEFNNLPVLSEDDDASVVRFRFPDSTTQVRAFPRDGPAKMMYTFVRKFMFPNRFKLLVGFPMQEIQDDNTPIRMLSPMNHFIVLVGDDS